MISNGDYLNRWNELDNDFSFIRQHMMDIRSYILPGRGRFIEDGTPSSILMKPNKIFDNTAGRANRILGAGMQSGLCSPSRPWFRLGLLDADRANFGPVKTWLSEVERIMYQVYARSNFYNSIHTCFADEGGYGSSVLFQQEHDDFVASFRCFGIGEYRLSEGADGTIDTVYRKIYKTARQLEQMFGKDKLSTDAQSALTNNTKDKYFVVIHAIEPRKDRNPNKKDAVNMPYASVWFQPEEPTKKLHEGGFEEFPAPSPRWSEISGSPYGNGPGYDALRDTKMLQELQKTGLKGLHKMVDPPMRVDSRFAGVLNLTPGATNKVTKGDKDSVGTMYDIRLPLGDLEAKIQNVQRAVREDYYADLFLMIASAGRDMTATEVIERQEEKLLMLGPTIERQLHELLDPTLDRTYNILQRNGLLPEPPEDLQGAPIKVIYISLLAQAQRLVEASGLNTHVALVERLALIDPSSLAKTDFDKIIEEHGDIVGVPPGIVRSQEDTDALRQAEAEAAQQAAQMEQAQAAARTAKDLSAASTDTDNALTELAGAAGQ